MGTLLLDDPVHTDDLLSFDRVSSGWATGTAWDEAWSTNPATGLVHSGQLAQTGINATSNLPIQTLERIANNQPGTKLTPDEADVKYAIPGELSFKDYQDGIPEQAAKLLHGWKQEEIARRDILSRSTPGFIPGAARLGTGFAASALDPVNVASAFIPVLEETRFAAMAGKIGLTGARLVRGALEGAAGQAAIEPLILLQARTEQSDYDMYDSLLNVTFGALLGAGLHAGGGLVKDRIVGAPDLRPETSGRVEAPAMSADAHHAALSGAVAAVAEDRPVRSGDVVDAIQRERAQISRGYDETLRSPMSGPANEVLASINPDELREILIRRGAAFERGAAGATNAELVVGGDELNRLLGTRRNFGMVKFIFDAGEQSGKSPEFRISKDDVLALPEVVRDYETAVPETRTSNGTLQREYRIERDGHKVVYVTSQPAGDKEMVVSIYRQEPNRAGAEKPLSVKKTGSPESLARGWQPSDQDTAGAINPFVPRSQGEPASGNVGAGAGGVNATMADVAREQAAGTARPSEIATLSSVDATAKGYAQPATIETESAALQEWTANDTELVNQQRAAGNLDEADEAVLKDGDAVEQIHLNRAKALEALGQCLIA